MVIVIYAEMEKVKVKVKCRMLRIVIFLILFFLVSVTCRGRDAEIDIHGPNSTFVIYDGCLVSKPCFSPIQYFKGLPSDDPDCILSMNCEVLWSVGKQPIHPEDAELPDPGKENIVLELYATSTAWVAVGLSEDRSMGEDYVLECVKENNTNVPTAKLYNSWNYLKQVQRGKKLHDNLRSPGPGDVAELIEGRVDDNSIYCMIHLKKAFKVTNPISAIIHLYDLDNDKFCLLMAYSENMKTTLVNGTVQVTGIGTHYNEKRAGYAPCREFISLTHRYMPNRSQVRTLQIHGAIQIIGYVGCLATSVFVARYYRTTLADSIRGYEMWVWVHGIFAAVSVILEMIAISQFVRGKQGWKNPVPAPLHTFFGYSISVLAPTNLILGYYIRRTDSIYERARCFYLFHKISGHVSLVFSLFLVSSSHKVDYAFVTCDTGQLATIFFFVYFAIHLIMSFNRYWLNKLAGSSEDTDIKMSFLNPVVLLTQQYEDDAWYIEDKKVSRTKKLILVIVFAFFWTFAAILVMQILESDHSCAQRELKVHQDK